jgi:predicted Zn-dependent protease
MLARMENEAQLSTVIGHELTHFTHRHAVKERRVVRNRTAYANALKVLLVVAVGPAGLGHLGGREGELWALASVRGYSRELEAEADREGIRMMVRSGYDPREAPRVFQHLQEDRDKNSVREPFALGTHPLLQERIDNYRRLISTDYAAQAQETGRLTNSEGFLVRTEQLLLDNAVLDLRMGRTGTARAAIDKYLKRKPGVARAHFLLGEVNRRTASAAAAISAYQEAVRLDPAYADALRELGLICRAEGWLQDARDAFTRYLALDPAALDAPIIKGYLAEPGTP